MEQGKEELFESFITKIETIGTELHITKIKAGTVVEESSVDLGMSINNASRNISGTTYNGLIYYNGRNYYTGWYYSYSHTGSNIFAKLTYAVILQVLMEIAGLIPGVDPIPESLESIAQQALWESIPIIYWHKDIYHVNQVTFPGRQLYGSYIGQRTYVDFYSDSSMTNYLGSEMYEWRDPVEWPTGLSIGSA